MSFFIPRVFAPATLGVGLGLATTCFIRSTPRHVLRCDTSPVPASAQDWSYSRNAQVPVIQKGRVNPAAYRQISSGSILGLATGLALSTFSRPLTILLGLLIVGIQMAANRGIHVIPYRRIQTYVQSIDLRSLLEDNAAFKLSFGTTFALAAFAEF